jgi:hypothetical protein
VKDLLSLSVYAEKPNATVPAISNRDNSRAHSGEDFEEMGRANDVIEGFMLRHSSNQHPMLE